MQMSQISNVASSVLLDAALPDYRLMAGAEVAAVLNVNRRTVLNAAKAGRLRCKRVGRSFRYEKADVLEWLAQSTEGDKAKLARPRAESVIASD